jgi:hypothetical protein
VISPNSQRIGTRSFPAHLLFLGRRQRSRLSYHQAWWSPELVLNQPALTSLPKRPEVRSRIAAMWRVAPGTHPRLAEANGGKRAMLAEFANCVVN